MNHTAAVWTKRLQRMIRGEGLRAQLLRGGVGSIGIKVGQTCLALGLAVVLARVLGPEGFGIYSYALSLIMVAAMPVHAGLATLATREIAAAQQRKDWSLIRGLLRRIREGFTLYAVFVIGLGAFGLLLISERLDRIDILTFTAALALFPITALVRVNGGVLRGFGRVLAAQIPDQIIRQFVLLIFVCIAVIFAENATSPQLAMALHVVAASIALIVGAVWLSKSRPEDSRTGEPQFKTRAWLMAAFPLTFIGGMQLINSQFDILMLGPLAGAESVGIYRVAVQGASIVAFGLSAINLVIGPHIAYLYTARDYRRLQRMITASAQMILGISIPATGLFLFFGSDILRWVFGPPYSDGAVALAILCIGQLVNATVGSVGLILNMTGHERDTAVGVALAAMLNVLLNIILIPRYGIEGAATATAISTASWNLLLARRVFARTGLISLAIPLRTYKGKVEG